MKIKGVLFDLDGTLANTLQDLKDSLNMAMSDLGLPLHDDEGVIKCLNNGMKMFIMRSVPEELRTDELLERVSEKYHHYYSLNHIKKTYFYDGINELLHRLKAVYGMKIAVISNKDNLYTKNIVNALDTEHCVDIAYGFREGIPHKPAPDSVYGIIEELGLKKEEVVLVGDSNVDVKTARNAGITSFGVLWGFKGAQSFTDEQPDYLLEKPCEIEKFLLEMK
ncbi:MAG: HAD family hydrolase [Ruminococcaceae bacterium]|nr:HAD family hydrolase [Oscillospiraceae bacterium]